MAKSPKSPRDETAPRRVGRPVGPTAQGATSRKHILKAAASVFSKLGYDRARVADVIDASGLTRGAVYFHFESKEALAIAVLSAKQDEWIEAVTDELEHAERGVPRLRALLPAMLTLHRNDEHAWAIARLSYSLAELPDTRELTASLTKRWIAVVATLIEEARSSPSEKAAEDAEALATVIVGAFDGLKATVNIIAGADAVKAQEELARGGAILERMMLGAILDGA